jgi:DNA-binding CsgD family transcriptional regulator
MSETSEAARARLSVAITAADPDRAARLARTVVKAGHEIVADPALADAHLVDLASGAAPPEGTLAPLLLLTDAAHVPGEAEIEGILSRRARPEQVDAALRAIAAGLRVRAADAPQPGFSGADEEPHPLLTPRELEVLHGISDGLSNKALARRLGISAHTVKFHLEAVFAKLGASTRAQAVAKGLRTGLIEI